MGITMNLKVRSYNPAAEQTDKETMAAWQLHKLQKLLEYAYATSRFYRDWMDKAQVKPEKIRSLSDFSKMMPLLRKEHVLEDQVAEPPYGSRLTAPHESLVLQHISGGTSGRGQEMQGLTLHDRMQIAYMFAYGFYYAGVDSGDVVAMTLPITTSSGGTAVYDSLQRIHARVLPIAAYDTVTKLKLMRQHRARVILATPAYLDIMSSTAREQLGWDLAKDLSIEIILTATEAFSVDRALSIEKAWGAKMFEWYGASQRVGAANCHLGAIHDGERGLLHHFPHLEFVETINRNTGEPVEYGEDGEVVVTFLTSQASPLIRYATNDKARLLPASSCPCGICFDGYETGTISRYDDMIKVRGLNLWPITIDDIVLVTHGVKNYGGLVTNTTSGREDLFVSVEFEASVSQEQRTAILGHLAEKIREQTGLRMTVMEARKPLPEFKDSESKARRWRDERSGR
jgi:phenylacetate-CoA ligase